VDFIFLRKNHSPHEGVQAAGAKTNSHFSPQKTQKKNENLFTMKFMKNMKG
jgi:hypothetical protein